MILPIEDRRYYPTFQPPAKSHMSWQSLNLQFPHPHRRDPWLSSQISESDFGTFWCHEEKQCFSCGLGSNQHPPSLHSSILLSISKEAYYDARYRLGIRRPRDLLRLHTEISETSGRIIVKVMDFWYQLFVIPLLSYMCSMLYKKTQKKKLPQTPNHASRLCIVKTNRFFFRLMLPSQS